MENFQVSNTVAVFEKNSRKAFSREACRRPVPNRTLVSINGGLIGGRWVTETERMKWKNRNMTQHSIRCSPVVIPRRKEADECPQLRGGTVQENICNVDAIHLVVDLPHSPFIRGS